MATEGPRRKAAPGSISFFLLVMDAVTLRKPTWEPNISKAWTVMLFRVYGAVLKGWSGFAWSRRAQRSSEARRNGTLLSNRR